MAFIAKYIMFSAATLQESLLVALKEIPANTVEVIVGIIIVLLLARP